MLTSSLHEFAYNGLMGYNGFLTACAVMYFFVPSRKSALLSIVSVVATLAVQVGFSWAFNDVSTPHHIILYSFMQVKMCLEWKILRKISFKIKHLDRKKDKTNFENDSK